MKVQRRAAISGQVLRFVFVLVVAAAVALAVWYSRRAAKVSSATSAASLLPAESIAFLHIADLEGARDDWHRSDLYRLYQEPAVHAFLGRSTEKLPSATTAQSLSADLTALDVRAVFVAMTDAQKFVGGFSFAARADKANEILERSKTQLSYRSFANKRFGTEYQGHTLDVLTLNDATFATTFVRDRLFFATDVEDLKALLDRADGRQKAGDLAHDKAFLSAVAHMPAGHALMLFGRPAAVAPTLPRFANASAFCYALRFDGGNMRDVTFIAEPQNGDAAISRASLNMATADTFLYSDTLVNVGNRLSQAQTNGATFPLLSQLHRAIADANVTGDEWKAAFGDELSLIGNWAEKSRWPSPLVAVPVKDVNRANQLALRVAGAAFPGRWSDDARGGIRYHTLPTLTGFMLFNPTVGVSDKWLIFGLDPASVEAAFGRMGSTSALAQSRSYRAAAADVPAPREMFAYVDLPQLYQRLDASLRPLLQMAGALMPAISDYFDVSKMPPADVVTRHLSAVVASQRYDRDGYVTESFGTVTLPQATLGAAAGSLGAISGRPANWRSLLPPPAAHPSATP